MKYEDAGVNISKADFFIEKIKPLAQATLTDFVLEGIGPFASLVELKGYKNPVLVSGTDGVGTKLKIAFMMNKHDTVGIDLVAMCVNDVITTGAKPLFFLDYFACGKLDENIGVDVIKGIAQGCTMAKCALVGGETAEMPSFYPEGEYDLAGFCVGVAEKEELLNPETVSVGDAVIGLASSGLHSNGYSLVRKIFFEQHHFSVNDQLPELGKTLGEELLTPTLIYVRALELLQGLPIKAAAHITGGGLLENVPRVLPEGTAVKLHGDAWFVPPIFKLIQQLGNVDLVEMYRTFNMGIGMVLIVPEERANDCVNKINSSGDFNAQIIGEVVAGERQVILP
ncbi:MAG TPA: phosphoribosylformylglycinamidine cyclo-ligase [Coprothermobacter proteolyticus]|uniref:Phosphoribosylformylglycinamidine cyclo-ligase n=1 Tax=Coprothermobacter proteolyticus (strain ATCC 35245 / DSM 5265 / OCM 4 / BT) TaxID=309798 RepID=B5Y719_COPPD|nr:phosphoribosylformylglycinamidine cyclo-ligase [Coprothermobacter proteolyticus]ACI17838.1 phosphoribosylaminoimidazole synthetase [Coprothermobacter proteolyticus DSM 5265]HPU70276.1 phosphoribosylformylglycinamidine cyclo-ligase [Coprothermobacter proteolyticus]